MANAVRPVGWRVRRVRANRPRATRGIFSSRAVYPDLAHKAKELPAMVGSLVRIYWEVVSVALLCYFCALFLFLYIYI